MTVTNINHKSLLKKPGRHRVDKGLVLKVVDGGARAYWLARYYIHGIERETSLGSAYEVSLAHAKDKHLALRSAVRNDKIDPVAVKRAAAKQAQAKAKAEEAASNKPTFGEAAADYIAAHEKGWANSKHAGQWAMTLLGSRDKDKDYCAAIRSKPVDQVTTADVVKVLTPIWHRVPETASRLRGRIECVLDAARALGLIDENRANVARWKGHLDKLLTKPKKLTRGHHAALDAADVPALMRDLQAMDSVAARATIFTVLTATRTNEALGMTWAEIDFETAVWTIPKARSKVGRDFRVPLAPEAVAILRRQEAERGENDHVFPGRPMRGLSNMSMLMTLRRLKVEATTHGIARSTFRDWAEDEAGFAREICEMALGHSLGAVERAYRRGDAFERRCALMVAWAKFLFPPESEVIAFPTHAAE